MTTELELRLNELEQPGASGERLDRHGFIKLVVLTVLIPMVMIAAGWMLIA